jgi:sporulation protein YlmC with PRC-barrel domain
MVQPRDINMDTNASPQPPAFGTHSIDPNAHLHTQMRVIGEQGKPLGKVETLVHDSNTGAVSALVIRHGLLRRNQTLVSADQVKQVNQDSVVLRYSQSTFKRLPKMATSG